MTRHLENGKIPISNAKKYAAEIQYVAAMKACGVVPLTLQNTDPEEAQKLGFVIGRLDELHLLPLVDQRVKKIQQQNEPEPQKAAHRASPPEPPGVMKQDNFFSLVPETSFEYKILPPRTTPTAGDRLEATIDRWHRIFQSKDPHDRNRVLASEAQREWRKFLQSIGYTEKHFTAQLRAQTAQTLQRFEETGVLQMLYQHMTHKEQLEMIAILKKFDADHRQPWRAWESSDGLTVYPNVKSWNRDHR